jgi:hypothetical protein
MYCPYCGRAVTLIDGVLTCTDGEMPLSPHLQAVLAERFAVDIPRPPDVAEGQRLDAWFCPACGVRLGPGLICPSCGRTLRDLHHQLVELHPHRDEEGNW